MKLTLIPEKISPDRGASICISWALEPFSKLGTVLLDLLTRIYMNDVGMLPLQARVQTWPKALSGCKRGGG